MRNDDETGLAPMIRRLAADHAIELLVQMDCQLHQMDGGSITRADLLPWLLPLQRMLRIAADRAREEDARWLLHRSGAPRRDP